MAMPIEASEVAVGDWSPNYGTVMKVSPREVNGKVSTIAIEFFSGYSIMVKPDEQLEILQGGADVIHNGMPDKSQIRPGLAADHADG